LRLCLFVGILCGYSSNVSSIRCSAEYSLLCIGY
jgi:hypothetical protein